MDFFNLTIETSESDLTIADVPDDEVFPLDELSEFRIRLCNRSRMGEIVDFAEWVEMHRR